MATPLPSSPRTSLPNFLSVREVAALLGVAEVTIWRMKRRGILPPATRLSPHRIGWSEEAIAAYLAARTPTVSTAVSDGRS